MIKFNKKYVDDNTYPISLKQFLTNLCVQVGLELGNETLINGDYMIQGNPFLNNETCKTVLSHVAQLCAGFAYIATDDKVYVQTLSTTAPVAESLDGDSYYTLKTNEQLFGPVNSLIIKVSENITGEESIRETDGTTDENRTQVAIIGNYFLGTVTEREAVIDVIFNAVEGLEYLPVDMKHYGFPYIIAGDKLKVTDLDDTDHITYVLNHSFKYSGIFTGTLTTEALTKTQSAYKNVIDITSSFKDVNINVDKINQQIALINQDITDLTDFINNITFTGNILHLGNTVESIGAINKLTIKGFELMELYPGMAYPSQYPGVLSFYTLVIDDIDTFDNNPLNVYINSPIPLQQLTVGEKTIYDELVIEKGKARVIQKIGYEDDELVVLTTPITHEIEGDILIPTVETDTFIKVLYFDNLIFNCEYLMKNAFTNIFTTQIETSAIQTITNNNINMKVSKGEVISEINLSSEEAKINASKISLTATDIINLIAGNEINLTSKNITIASDNFNVDLDGNMACNNAEINSATIGNTEINGSAIVNGTNFNVDKLGNLTCKNASLTGNVYLPTGGKVIGGDGILTNLQFNGISSDKDFLGYYPYFFENVKSRIVFEVNIPANFTITSARLVLHHSPIYWSYLDEFDTRHYFWGYCRNLNLYKLTDNNMIRHAVIGSEFFEIGDVNLTNLSILNFTATTPSSPSHNMQTVTTSDFKSSLSVGYNKLILQTSVTPPTFKDDYIEQPAREKTGNVIATVEIVGYMST